MASNRLIYSTEHGRTCPRCRKPLAKSRCKSAALAPEGDGIVRVMRSTKGRKGKGVTVITGIPLQGAELKALAKRLKARCGSGGTVKDGAIEIQGDHRDLMVEVLSADYTVKRVGG